MTMTKSEIRLMMNAQVIDRSWRSTVFLCFQKCLKFYSIKSTLAATTWLLVSMFILNHQADLANVNKQP